MTADSKTLELATDAYGNREFDRAKTLLDQLIESSPDVLVVIRGRYLRARGYEDGNFSSGKNLDAALRDYQIISENEAGSRALVGCARIMFEKNPAEYLNEIIGLCERAIKIDQNPKAMMVLGVVYGQVSQDEKLSRAWFFKAFLRGLPWGLTFIARSFVRENKLARGYLMNLLAAAVTPIMELKFGRRSPFK